MAIMGNPFVGWRVPDKFTIIHISASNIYEYLPVILADRLNNVFTPDEANRGMRGRSILDITLWQKRERS